MTEKYQPADIKVLVVEDHSMMKKSILDILRQQGFETILAAAKARDAILAIKRNPIDFVLLDLYLAEGSGLEVLEFIRSQQTRFDIPVLIISGEASKDDIVRAIELGSSDYLVKPFQTSDFEKKIESVLGSYFTPSEVLKLVREAETLLHKNQLPEALALIKKTLEIDSNNTRANYLHAIVTDAMGDTERAIGILMTNRSRNENYLKNYSALADMFIKQLKPDLAIKALQNELKINPKDAQRQILLANLLKDSEEYDQAINHYRKALVENNSLKKALVGMGDCFAALENSEKALYYYRRLRKNYPNLNAALGRIVDLAMDSGQPKLAENYLKTEIKSHPMQCDLYVSLSKLYCRLGDREAAEELLAIAREKFEDHTEVWELSGYLNVQFNEIQKALAIYEKVYQRERAPRISLELAKLYHRTKKYDHALRYLQRYTSSTGDFSEEILSRLFYLSAYNRQWVKAALLAQRYAKAHDLGAEMTKLQQAVIKNLGKRRTATKGSSPTGLAS